MCEGFYERYGHLTGDEIMEKYFPDAKRIPGT